MEEITYEDIRKEIEGIYKKLNYLYGKANTKSKQRRLITTIGALDEICGEDCLDFNIDNSHLIETLYMERKFFDYFDDVSYNLNFLRDLSLKVIHTYRKNNYPFYKRYKSRDYIPDDDMYKLIINFFHSFNDESIDKFIKKTGDNYYFEFPSDKIYEGALYALPIFKKYIVHLNTSNKQDLFFATVTAHEMGHAYEKELFYNNAGTYLSDKYTDTIFFEVVSSFFEYAFINYLNDNNYYPKEIKHEYDTYYLQLFNWAFNTYTVCLNGIDNMDRHYQISLDNKDKMDRIEKLKEMVNYYNGLPNYKEMISVLHSVIYFVGEILAINLYDKYKDNPKEFMKNFRTVLVNYPRTGLFDSFEVVGITKDELLSGKVLKKELNKFIISDDRRG